MHKADSDSAEVDPSKTVTALHVATNPPTALMAAFGKIHAEQIARYGNPDDLPTEGLDHKQAGAPVIAYRIGQICRPPL
ncbi:MAG: hypothetical protein V7730_06585 [Sulfitobacter sp.]